VQLGIGLLGLELQIGLIEGRERLPDLDGVANFDEPLGNLAGNAKAHVSLDPGPDGADKAPLRIIGFIMHGGDQDRSVRGGFLGDLLVAAGQQDRDKSQRRAY
jgi:hypothetical protein